MQVDGAKTPWTYWAGVRLFGWPVWAVGRLLDAMRRAG
jgi:hypothetical protein